MATASDLRRLAGLVAPVVAVTSAAVAVAAVDNSLNAGTTYAGTSPLAHAADLAAGLGLVAAGMLAWVDRSDRRVGVLTLLAGAVWFAPDWEGWDRGSAVVRSVGAVAAPLLFALIFHLVLTARRGLHAQRFERVAIGVAYAVALSAGAGRALFRDPLLDPYCWRNCLDNVFLVHGDQSIAQAFDRLWLAGAVIAGALLAALVIRRTVTATSAARRALVPVLLPGAAVGATQAAYAVALLRHPLEPATSFEFSSLFLARALALTALALGLAWTIVRARRLRAAVVRLTSDLGEAAAPGTLREALAAAVGDGSLEIAYWLPASGRYVDAAGRTVEPPALARGRTVTSIVRGGRPLAVVAHDSALVDSVGLEQRLGSATRLAVENERLQAEVLAQLEDLRASRARIVESGDAARRRLERDLHDGAQQRLLALSYDLRLARSAAEDDRDPELTRLLGDALDEAQAALLDLRELAHGIYPAILEEAGLASALATLADEAPLAVEFGEVPAERYGAQVETAAYLVVADAIGEASSRGANALTARVVRAGDRLVVTTGDDGAPRGSPPIHLADRIGALGGSIGVAGATLRAEIPCA